MTRAGAEYIKTSTGFSTGGATFEAVALMKEHVGPFSENQKLQVEFLA